MSDRAAMPSEEASLHRPPDVTYHIAPVDVWESQMFGTSYEPEGFAQEGFIHCTDTLDELVAVGNRYYQDDPRPFVVLAIDCDEVTPDIVYEDERQIFPHIYGPLNLDAVISVQPVLRAADGSFLSMG
jgi:uncharacterized protein (DUF952 family)